MNDGEVKRPRYPSRKVKWWSKEIENHNKTEIDKKAEDNYKIETVTVTYTKYYDGFLITLAQLTDLERYLLVYTLENMTIDNTVTNNIKFKEDFLEFLKTYLGINYSNKSIERAFKSLREMEILFKVDKGVYKINPKMFWKDRESLRYKTIQKFKEAIEEYRISSNDNKVDFIITE